MTRYAVRGEALAREHPDHDQRGSSMLNVSFADRIGEFGEEVFASLNEKLIKLQGRGGLSTT